MRCGDRESQAAVGRLQYARPRYWMIVLVGQIIFSKRRMAHGVKCLRSLLQPRHTYPTSWLRALPRNGNTLEGIQEALEILNEMEANPSLRVDDGLLWPSDWTTLNAPTLPLFIQPASLTQGFGGGANSSSSVARACMLGWTTTCISTGWIAWSLEEDR